jgi:hypothetical protein
VVHPFDRDDALRGDRSARTRALGREGPSDILRFFLDEADGWQAEIRTLSEAIASELSKAVNLLLNRNRSLLDEIAGALATLRGEGGVCPPRY